MLIVGETLSAVFVALRTLAGTVQAATSSEAMSLAQLLAEGMRRPLLLVVGASALALGSRLRVASTCADIRQLQGDAT
jgi:hypothetical protein